MSDLWFPGTDRSRPAPSDGGSILGGPPKCLWHDTETNGLPAYSTGFFPNMTLDPVSGHTWQHIPADRAARALRNPAGGVQTNRWNVFQIEVIGWVNKVPFHPVMAEVARWLHEVRGTPLQATVDWLPYDASFGNSRVRLSGAAWTTYAGHLGHMHAPENDHGDPGWPFPIDRIIAAKEDDVAQIEGFTDAAQTQLVRVLDRGFTAGLAIGGQTTSNGTVQVLIDLMKSVDEKLGQVITLLTPPEPPPPIPVLEPPPPEPPV